MHPTASTLVLLALPALALLVTLLSVSLAARVTPADGVRRLVLGAAGWLALTGLLGASGLLLRFDLRPPPFVPFFLCILGAGVLLARSELGGRLARGTPLATLVLLQSFRLPLELVMHRAYAEGTMPRALSFSGENFDVVTGALALLLGLRLQRGPVAPWVVHAWNLLGMAALVNIARIALLSSPLIGAYGPDQLNTWVAWFPFVWLPAVLVVIAIAGHGVVLRALGEQAVQGGPRRGLPSGGAAS